MRIRNVLFGSGLALVATACGDNLPAIDDGVLVDAASPDAALPDAGPPAAVVIRLVGGAPSEAGATATYAVRLTATPTADVVVPLSVDAPDEATPSTLELTFTPADALVEQAVILTGVDDDVDDGDQPVTLAAGLTRSADPGFAGLLVAAPPTTNADDDTAGVAVEVLSAMSTEGGEAAVVTVALTSEPVADVTIAVASSDATEASAALGALTFTAATWAAPQTLVLTGVDDDVADGDIDYTVQLTPASADPLYAALSPAAPALRNADDDAVGISVGPMSDVTTEAGDAATFQIVLDSEPTADVTIPVLSGDPSEGTVAITALTFTPADWDVVQDVVVTGVDDAVDDDDQDYALPLGPASSADPAYDGRTLAPVAARNLDDDTAQITTTPLTTDTTEAGGTATFTVVLASEPTADVMVALASSDPSEGVTSATTLTFTAGTWAVPQTVTVTGQDDAVDDGDVAYAVTFGATTSADPGYAALTPADLAARNLDDDAAGITLAPAGLTTTEAGGTTTFTLVLDSEPTADVTIALVSDDPGEGAVDPATLTFTPADWATPQPVTVTGVDDAFVDGDVAYAVAFVGATSADPGYAGRKPPPLALTNQDDDTAGYLVVPSGASTTEAGGTMTFTVALTAAPQQPVTLPLGSDDLTEGAADVTELSFDDTTWNLPQLVTVTGVDDAFDDGDVGYQLDFGAAVSADAAFAGTAPASLDLTNIDDDVAGISVSAASGHTSEAGDTATFTVVLDAAPTADVALAVLSADLGEGTADPATLTFTTADWASPQTVTVTGVDDAIVDGPQAYAVDLGPATSADAAFAGLSASAALVNDDDGEPSPVCGLASCWGGDDFEDGDLAGWSIGGNGGAVSTATAADGTTTSALVTTGTSTHQTGLRRTWAGCTPSKISLWVNPSASNVAHNYVVLGRNAGGASAGNVIFMYSVNGVWRFVSSTSLDTIATAPDTWTKVEYTFDWTARTYDATIGGTQVLDNFAFRDPGTTSLGQLDLYNFNAGANGRWDEIEVYCD